MGFWKKESKTHFVRDEAGKVVEVQRSGDQPKSRGTPVSDALMKQHYEKHPEQRPGARAKKRISGIVSALDTYSKNYARSHQPPRVSKNSNRRYVPEPRPPLGSYSFGGNYNPIGGLFDSGVSAPKISKKKSEVRGKYVIVDGVAYPKAKTSKKKKKNVGKGGGKRRKKHDPNDPFSFPDFF